MSVVVAVEDVGVCRKQLTIEVPAPAVEAESTRVAEEYRKAAKLPGFRKGKVPMGVVRQRFGDEIRKEVIDRLVPRYWHQAEAESSFDPLMPPSVERVDFDDDSKLTFDAIVEVRPEIELGDLESFELPEMEIEPSDEELDSMIEDLRRGLADWKDADRPAAVGDLVVCQIREVEEEGDGNPTPVTIEVGDPNVWEELTLAVTGQKAGTEAGFDRVDGEEKSEYKVAIETVRERDLPPIDDELAKKIGNFDNVEALREGLTERMRVGKTQERRRARERAVLDQLRERNPLEVPSGVVDRETENLLRSYAEDLSHRGIDPQNANINWQELFEQSRPQGELEVKGRLLLDAVVAKLGVEVSEDEFEASLAALAKVQGKSTPAVRQALDRAGRLGELRTQLARDLALKRLMGEEPEKAEEATAEEPKDG